jgi:hypothetical protein
MAGDNLSRSNARSARGSDMGALGFPYGFPSFGWFLLNARKGGEWGGQRLKGVRRLSRSSLRTSAPLFAREWPAVARAQPFPGVEA